MNGVFVPSTANIHENTWINKNSATVMYFIVHWCNCCWVVRCSLWTLISCVFYRTLFLSPLECNIKMCSSLQLVLLSVPRCLCSPPPQSSSLEALPHWPVCWLTTPLRGRWWAGRWTGWRWARGSGPVQKKRRKAFTDAAASWPWARQAGSRESSTPAGSPTSNTPRPPPFVGASVWSRTYWRRPTTGALSGEAGVDEALVWSGAWLEQ